MFRQSCFINHNFVVAAVDFFFFFVLVLLHSSSFLFLFFRFFFLVVMSSPSRSVVEKMSQCAGYHYARVNSLEIQQSMSR